MYVCSRNTDEVEPYPFQVVEFTPNDSVPRTMDANLIFETTISGDLPTSISIRGSMVAVLFGLGDTATMGFFDYRQGRKRFVSTGLDTDVSCSAF